MHLQTIHFEYQLHRYQRARYPKVLLLQLYLQRRIHPSRTFRLPNLLHPIRRLQALALKEHRRRFFRFGRRQRFLFALAHAHARFYRQLRFYPRTNLFRSCFAHQRFRALRCVRFFQRHEHFERFVLAAAVVRALWIPLNRLHPQRCRRLRFLRKNFFF